VIPDLNYRGALGLFSISIHESSPGMSYTLDSTTIKLFANCMDWAKHRRRKAVAKLHLRLNLDTFLPAFAVVDSAKGHDSTKSHELCAGLKAGEIAVFGMAYIDYAYLFDLTERGVFWVSRVKDSMKFRCVPCCGSAAICSIICDLMGQQAPRSITPSLHYSISHGVNTHLALLQHATDQVLANSAIGSTRGATALR
jgi:hypothetical protein